MSRPRPTTQINRALCHARQCELPVHDGQFMCPQHWAMVPAPMRAVIRGPGHEAPSEAIVRAAIDAVAHRESRETRRPVPAQRLRTPVQLALFELP